MPDPTEEAYENGESSQLADWIAALQDFGGFPDDAVISPMRVALAIADLRAALAERDAMLAWTFTHGVFFEFDQDALIMAMNWWDDYGRRRETMVDRDDGTPAGRAEALHAAIRKAMTEETQST